MLLFSAYFFVVRGKFLQFSQQLYSVFIPLVCRLSKPFFCFADISGDTISISGVAGYVVLPDTVSLDTLFAKADTLIHSH